MRVVSVLPSATEIVFALGHGRELVGRSAECDFPEEVTSVPIVMHPRSWDQDRPSGEIDARVRSVRATGESLYTLDVERLRGLRPDLLLTQDLCGVCSVTDREVEEACAVAGVRPRILSLSPRRLEDVWRSVEQVGAALGDSRRGETVATVLRERAESRGGPATARVAIVEWLDPPILAGLWTPEIIAAGGGVPLGPGAGDVGERTSWEAIRALRPDLVVLSPCSFTVGRTRRELANARISHGVASVKPRLGTFIADEAYFSRPGPRLADGVELVRRLVDGAPAEFPMPVDRWSSDEVGASA
ncbi:MAG TPA: cobalamin-binding protein [Thermoplasmata archaeon]|nr:cobalamin-binding protein [Thermoplasmata archaeon]